MKHLGEFVKSYPFPSSVSALTLSGVISETVGELAVICLGSNHVYS